MKKSLPIPKRIATANVDGNNVIKTSVPVIASR